MAKEQFEREKHYCAAISVAKSMLIRGLITEEEYRKIDTIFRNKYRPVIDALQAEIALTCGDFRGNM